MIQFLLKGIMRDKSRSWLPIIILTIGVSLTVLLSGYLRGVMGDLVDQSARFDTGHVKIMSKAYAENISQMPNDLALLDVGVLIDSLTKAQPDYQWVKRIKFGGLIDVPDSTGNTKGQGPAMGMALELFSNPESGENTRMNIDKSLVTGNAPQKSGEVLISHNFAEKLKLQIGDKITYFGTTMNGSMTFQNFSLCGTIKFGNSVMDRGAIIVDVSDAQKMLDMEDGSGEILGYARNNIYDDKGTESMAKVFNQQYAGSQDEFAPMMVKLKDQNNLADYIDYVDVYAGMFVFIFVVAMSVVLWNTGLLGGLRRYKEFGIRLALGESKGQIYRSLILEALLIGFIGSVCGTIIGLIGTYYMQTVGIDIGDMMAGSSMMMPSVLRSKFTPDLLYIGFIPGLFAMVLGNMLSGIGIYKRQTASLFKELEI